MTQTLLVELLTEELPPKVLAKLGDAFANGIFNGLKSRDFLEEGAVATAYATPRRLAVSISKVRATSLDKAIREKVLPVSVALDAEGRPAAPLVKKLAALAAQVGVTVITPDQLERAQDGKAESFFYNYTAKGTALQTGLQAALEESVAKLPIPKVMSYQRQHGRAAGDACLKQIAGVLSKAATRTRDFFARYGGEEFVLILPETDRASGLKVAQRCRKQVLKEKIPHEKSQVESVVTISLGMATIIPSRQDQRIEFMETVDKRLYMAKQRGRNCIVAED